MAEALAAHTAARAAAAGVQDDLGRIAHGMLADSAVVAGVPDGGSSHVQQTYVGGRRRWGCANEPL